MYLDSRSDLFLIELPKVFIPKQLKQKYAPYLKRMPIIIDDISDLINYSIQSVTIPAISYDPVEQQRSKFDNSENRNRGFKRTFRQAKNEKDLVNKEFTITFKMLDGFINYWIMYETFLYYYNFNNADTYTYDIPVRILDSDRNVMFTAMYKETLFTGLSEFTLSFADNIQKYSSFDCTFNYNHFDPYIPIQ